MHLAETVVCRLQVVWPLLERWIQNRKGESEMIWLLYIVVVTATSFAQNTTIDNKHTSVSAPSHTEERPTQSRNRQAIERFLNNPGLFLREEKEGFLKSLESENASKAAEVRTIFDRYETKFRELTKLLQGGNLADSLDRVVRSSQLRRDLSQLEEDLRLTLTSSPTLQNVIQKLRNRQWTTLTQEDWNELKGSLPEDLSTRLDNLVKDVDREFAELNRLRQEFRGKSISEIGAERIQQLRNRAFTIRDLERQIQEQLQRIEDLLRRNRLISTRKRFGEVVYG